jgi:DNA-binding response OmpR family regulator
MNQGAFGENASALPPLRLLLVDDNPRDRELLARELRNHFGTLEIASVRNRGELEGALTAGAFDAAVIDYQLKWTTGIEVLRTLKSERPNCPVIMFTASGSESIAVAAMKEGLDDYITKTAKHYARIPFALVACLQREQQRLELRSANLECRALADKMEHSNRRLELALQAARMRAWEDDLVTSQPGHDNTTLAASDAWITTAVNAFGQIRLEDAQHLKEAYQHSLSTAEPFVSEVKLRGEPAGHEVWIEVRGQPVRDASGRITRMRGVSMDISDRKQA